MSGVLLSLFAIVLVLRLAWVLYFHNFTTGVSFFIKKVKYAETRGKN